MGRIARTLLLLSVLLFAASAMVFAGGSQEEAEEVDDGRLRVVYVVNGVQGDRSFIDSAVRGLEQARDDFGISLKIIEAGLDPAKWKPYLEDAAANEEYDVLVAGSWSMNEYMEIVAPKHPDKKFIMYDGIVDYSTGNFGNVYTVSFRQNEGAYLGGAYAGLMTREAGMGALPGINDNPKLGVVGAQPIPVINDFIFPFKQGAEEVAGINADADVIVQHAGGWNDPAKGKELALTMYQQGADIVFQVAGGTGDGIFQAAREVGRYAIGVDSDQHMILSESNPELANTILTSVIKRVDNGVYRAIELHLEGELPYGEVEYVGLTENGVGIAKNAYYEEITPEHIKEQILELEAKIANGEIDVISAFDE